MPGLLMDDLNFYNGNVLTAHEDMFNGDPASDVVNMANYGSCMFVVVKSAGATGTATITCEACDDVTPTNSSAVAFTYKECTSGNTWGSTTEASSSGFTTTAGANQCYVCEVQADGLYSTYGFVRWVCTEVVNNPCDGAMVTVLGSPRYAQDVQVDATS